MGWVNVCGPITTRRLPWSASGAGGNTWDLSASRAHPALLMTPTAGAAMEPERCDVACRRGH